MQTTSPRDAPGERASSVWKPPIQQQIGGTFMKLRRKLVQPIRNLRAGSRFILLAFMLVVFARPTTAQQYQLIFLDDLGGNSRGNSINNPGWVAGFSIIPAIGKRHAALWRDGSIQDLGAIG